MNVLNVLIVCKWSSLTHITWDQALVLLFIIFASLLLWDEREKNNAWYIHLTSHQPPPNLHNLTSAWPLMLLANKRLPDGNQIFVGIMGAFHLVKISRISGSAVNGTRFVGSSPLENSQKKWKIFKKVVPFSRLEFPNGMSCSIYVSRTLNQFQVHCPAPPRTGVYDQMEQLFTNGKFHFCYHRNFRVFFLNGKRPMSLSPKSIVGKFLSTCTPDGAS